MRGFPFLETFKKKLPFFLDKIKEKKQILILLIILAVIPITIGAALTVQNFQQKASESSVVRFVDAAGETISTTDTQDVKLMLTLPDGWQLSSEQSALPRKSLVENAYAANSSDLVCGNVDFSPSEAKVGNNVRITVNGGSATGVNMDIIGVYVRESSGSQGFTEIRTVNCSGQGTSCTGSVTWNTTGWNPGNYALGLKLRDVNGTQRDADAGCTVGYTLFQPQAPTAPPIATATPIPLPSPTNTETQTAACNSIGLYPSSTVKQGDRVNVSVDYIGNPTTVEVWAADNNSMGKLDPKDLGISWNKITSGSAGFSLSFSTGDANRFAVGHHLVTIKLLNRTGVALVDREARCSQDLIIEEPASSQQNPNQPQTATPKILTSITIENKDTDGSTGGDQFRTITTADLKNALTQPITWNLNGLLEQNKSAERRVQVTFSDGTLSVPYTIPITLKPKLTLQSAAAPARELTQQLTSMLSQNAGISDMVEVAKAREEKLIDELHSSPQQFLSDATLANQRDQFPQEVQQHIEKHVNLQGTLETVHMDNLEEFGSKDAYLFQTGNDIYNLYYTNPDETIQPQQISVVGIALDDHIVSQSVPSGTDNQDLDSVHRAGLTGDIKVGVIKISRGITDFFPSDSELDQMLTHETDSIKHYFETVSYGKVRLTFEHLGAYSPPEALGICDRADLGKVSVSADQEATNNRKDLSQYKIKIYLFPTLESLPCLRHGVAIGEGSFSRDINGVIIKTSGSAGVGIFGGITARSKPIYLHELGHALGMDHSNAIDCGVAKDYDTNCRVTEYGDAYSIMGAQDNPFNKDSLALNGFSFGSIHPDIVNKTRAGWISGSHVEKARESGTYTIYPQEITVSNNSPQVLEIISRINSVEKIIYYLGYDRRLNYNVSLPSGVTEGVSIFTFPRSELENLFSPPQAARVYLKRKNLPEVLSDGEVYQDDIHNISIKQIRHDENSVTVEVALGYAIPTPTTTPQALPTPTPGTGVFNTPDKPAHESDPTYVLIKFCFDLSVKDHPECKDGDLNGDGVIDEQDYKVYILYILGRESGN